MGRTSSASGRWILLRSSLSWLDWKMADEIATPPTWPDKISRVRELGCLLREVLTYPSEDLIEPGANSHLILFKKISGYKIFLLEVQFTYQANGQKAQLNKKLKNLILIIKPKYVILSNVCSTTAFPNPRGIYKPSGYAAGKWKREERTHDTQPRLNRSWIFFHIVYQNCSYSRKGSKN